MKVKNFDHSHALRGNAAHVAPRPLAGYAHLNPLATQSVAGLLPRGAWEPR